MRGIRQLVLLTVLCVTIAPLLRGEDIRLADNTRVNGMVEEVTTGSAPALKITCMDGQSRTIPLEDIVTINFRGREPRMLLTGTQEMRLINGDRLRGRLIAGQADQVVLDTYSLGVYPLGMEYIKGFLTMPQVGRAGRWAEEIIDEKAAPGEGRLLDQVIDRRGSIYKGVIRKLSADGLDVDHEGLLKVVSIPTLYLAGGSLAESARKAAPPFPSDVMLRIWTRDGSRLDGRIDLISLDRWDLNPTWDNKSRMSVREEEITAIQVLNSKRLYLSQLEPTRAKEQTILAPPQPYRMDRSCQGDVLTIGGHTYPWGIGVHADSELSFKLSKSFKTFQATIGIDAQAGKGGSVVFSVIGDGKELYKSPTVRGSDADPREISVSVEGVDELTLKVDSAGDLDLGDMADWALAQLLR